MWKIFKKKDEKYINNSEEARRERCNVLRYAVQGICEYKGLGQIYRRELVIDEKACELPRDIKWQFKELSYEVGVSPLDATHYKYSPEQQAEIDRIYKDNKGYCSRERAVEIAAKSKTKFPRVFPMDIYNERSENMLVPLTYVKIQSAKDLALPEEIKRLGKPVAESFNHKYMGWDRYLHQSLMDAATWDGEGIAQIPEITLQPKEGSASGAVRYDIVPFVDITINGVKATKYNLTYKEQYEIMMAIKECGQMSGEFISDGSEVWEGVLNKMPNGLYCEADAAYSINYLHGYGGRYTEEQVTKREQLEKERLRKMERMNVKSNRELMSELWEKHILDLCWKHQARMDDFENTANTESYLVEYMSYSILLAESLEKVIMGGKGSDFMSFHTKPRVNIDEVFDMNLSDDDTFHKIFDISDLEGASEWYLNRFLQRQEQDVEQETQGQSVR